VKPQRLPKHVKLQNKRKKYGKTKDKMEMKIETG
jgi:hypothetical protein